LIRCHILSISPDILKQAVKCKVAASTQNQAFNALLFLFRHILKKDFGDHKDIPRIGVTGSGLLIVI
jgi:hypothetical protein